MSILKSIIFFILMITLGACSFESDKDGGQERSESRGEDSVETRNASIVVDSDGDGIPDEIDPTPNIARFPVIGVHRTDKALLEMFLSEKDESLENRLLYTPTRRRGDGIEELQERGIRRKILDLHYNKVTDPNFFPSKNETITMEDFLTFPITRWQDMPFFIFRGKNEGQRNLNNSFQVDFFVTFNSLIGVTEIRDIEYSIVTWPKEKRIRERARLMDTNGSGEVLHFSGEIDHQKDGRLRRLIKRDVRNEAVRGIIENREEVGIRIEDFSYILDGQKLNWGSVKKNIDAASSLFIYSTPYGFKSEFVASQGKLIDGFHQVVKNILTDEEGRLIEVEGYKNSLMVPVDFDNLSADEASALSVQLIGANSLNEPMIAGEAYLISVQPTRDIARVHRKSNVTINSEETQINIGSYFGGEILEIRITGELDGYKQIKENSDIEISWLKREEPRKPPRGGGGIWDGPGCSPANPCYPKSFPKREDRRETKNVEAEIHDIERFQSHINWKLDDIDLYAVKINGSTYDVDTLSLDSPIAVNRDKELVFNLQVPTHYNEQANLTLKFKRSLPKEEVMFRGLNPSWREACGRSSGCRVDNLINSEWEEVTKTNVISLNIEIEQGNKFFD